MYSITFYLQINIFTFLIDPGMKLLPHWLGAYNREAVKYNPHFLLPQLHQGTDVHGEYNEHLETGVKIVFSL